jgi:hypothetical protein
MNYGIKLMIEFHELFLRETKKLSKKYKLIKNDIKQAIKEIEENNFGTPLGRNIYKKRVANSSIPTGKSGGFRIIVYQKIENKIVLLSIYSKTYKDSLTNEELRTILASYL